MPASLFCFIILIILEFDRSSCNLTASKNPDSAIDDSNSYDTVHSRARRTNDCEEENQTDEIANGLDGNFPKHVDSLSKSKLGPANEISDPDSIELDCNEKATDFIQNEDSIKYESKSKQTVQSEDGLDFKSKALNSGKETLPSAEVFIDEGDTLKVYLLSTSEDPYYNEAGARNNMSTQSQYSLHSSEESKTDIHHGEKNYFSNQMANHVMKGSVEATLNSNLSLVIEQRNVYIFNDSKSSTPLLKQNVNNLNPIAGKQQPSEVRGHESSNKKAIGAYFHSKILKSDVKSNGKYPTMIWELSKLERADRIASDGSEVSLVSGTSKDILSQTPLLPSTNNHSSFQRAFTNTFKTETNYSNFNKTDHEYPIVDGMKHESSTLPDDPKSKKFNSKIYYSKLVQNAESKHTVKTAQIVPIQTDSALSIANKTPQNEDDQVSSRTAKESPSADIKHTAKTAQIMPIQTDSVLSSANKTPQNEDETVTYDLTKKSLLADIKHTFRNAQIMPNRTDNVLIANNIRRKKVVPVTFVTADEILSTDSGFDFFEIVRIIKTDHNVQAYIINVLILYVPVFICDALLWLVIAKLFRHIRRQVVFNQSQASKTLTPSAGKCGSHIGELKDDGNQRKSCTHQRKLSQKLSYKSSHAKDGSDEEYRDSNTEFLTERNAEKIWFPPN